MNASAGLDRSPPEVHVEAVRIEALRGAAAFAEASALYRAVFGYDGREDALNPRLLTALVENGGTALGARGSSGELLGFCYGFPGRRDGVSYHYSQATVVAAACRGRGLGRALKSAQRDAARGEGAERMRWAFDPARVANAHFNLDVLGARGRWSVDDLYGLEEPSPRMIVEWEFDEPPRASPTPPRGHPVAGVPGDGVPGDGVPGDGVPGEGGLIWLGFDPAQGAAALTRRLSPLLEAGYAAESCSLVGAFGWYALRAPAAQIAGSRLAAGRN